MRPNDVLTTASEKAAALSAMLAERGMRVEPTVLLPIALASLTALVVILLLACCCCRPAARDAASQELLPKSVPRSNTSETIQSSKPDVTRNTPMPEKSVTMASDLEGGRGGGWGDLDSFETIERVEHPTTRRDARLAKYGLGEDIPDGPPQRSRSGPAPTGGIPLAKRGAPNPPARNGRRR